jgi:hypothetical protein
LYLFCLRQKRYRFYPLRVSAVRRLGNKTPRLPSNKTAAPKLRAALSVLRQGGLSGKSKRRRPGSKIPRIDGQAGKSYV